MLMSPRLTSWRAALLYVFTARTACHRHCSLRAVRRLHLSALVEGLCRDYTRRCPARLPAAPLHARPNATAHTIQRHAGAGSGKEVRVQEAQVRRTGGGSVITLRWRCLASCAISRAKTPRRTRSSAATAPLLMCRHSEKKKIRKPLLSSAHVIYTREVRAILIPCQSATRCLIHAQAVDCRARRHGHLLRQTAMSMIPTFTKRRVLCARERGGEREDTRVRCREERVKEERRSADVHTRATARRAAKDLLLYAPA